MHRDRKHKHKCDESYYPPWCPPSVQNSIIGPTGPMGDTGPEGPTGPIGDTGPTGPIFNPIFDVPNIDLFISNIGIIKPLSGLTGNVSGIGSASGTGAFSEGGGNIASGPYSHAEGLGTQSLSIASHSEGISTIADGPGAHSEGIATRALGTGAHSEGGGTIASGPYSHSEGDPCTALGYASHAEGVGCTASGTGAHAEGIFCISLGEASHAEGAFSEAIGNVSHVEGILNIVSGTGAHGEGILTNASGEASHAEGTGTIASGNFSHVEGLQCVASAIGSHCEGGTNLASGDFSHTEGIDCIASGIAAHSEGFTNKSEGIGSHAEGISCNASGDATHCEGTGTTASGTGAHAEGENATATAIGSHAEGRGTFSTANAAHAEGLFTFASGMFSHSEGNQSIASHNASHAEGDSNMASGQSSHAEGENCTASGEASHAEGFVNIASGDFSHAGGSNSTASNQLSYVQGLECISDLLGTHVIGFAGWSATGTIGVTGAANNGGIYSLQLAGGAFAPPNPGDGISVIIRTSTFGTPQPIGEIITNYFTTANADYAEYFEWDDGNLDNENRIGYFVELDRTKIRYASNSELCIGITSRTSNIMGDAAELGWHGTNLKDEFGRYITQENYSVPMSGILCKFGAKYKSTNTNKSDIIIDLINNNKQIILHNYFDKFTKISSLYDSKPSDINELTSKDYEYICGKYAKDNNEMSLEELTDVTLLDLKEQLENTLPVSCTVTSADYDPKQKYIPRSARKEWVPVGMIGKIYVRDNGKCIPGQRCDCINGIAVEGSRWPVLERINDHVIRILYK